MTCDQQSHCLQTRKQQLSHYLTVSGRAQTPHVKRDRTMSEATPLLPLQSPRRPAVALAHGTHPGWIQEFCNKTYANEILPNILSPTPTDRQGSVINQVNWLMCSIESNCSFSKLLVFKALLLSLIIVDKSRDATKRYYWEV